jgi:hypothetical protein
MMVVIDEDVFDVVRVIDEVDTLDADAKTADVSVVSRKSGDKLQGLTTAGFDERAEEGITRRTRGKCRFPIV